MIKRKHKQLPKWHQTPKGRQGVWQFIYKGELPTLNEMLADARRPYQKGASAYSLKKKQISNDIIYQILSQKLKPISKEIQVDCWFEWRCKDKRKDPDNISTGTKLVLDSLIEAGILKNDGWSEVGEIHHKFIVDKANIGVKLTMIEVERKE